MIFVTIGTTKFAFNRMFKTIDEALIELKIKEKLIVQKGNSDYQFKYSNIEVFKEVSFNKLILFMKKARIVITHGGPGSIYLCWQAGKKPIVITRLKKFDEHIDNHQLFFGRFLERRKLAKVISDRKELEGLIKNYTLGSKKGDIFAVSNHENKNLVQSLTQFTNSL